MGNKITTYLLYAIGEIILVVVGILIAVNIDDWSEKNKLQTKEESYLRRLKEEALWNVDALNDQIKFYQNKTLILDSVATLLSQGAPKNNDLKIPIAPYFIGAWRLRKSAYTELVSTGSLGILRDEKLREILEETASFEARALLTLNYWRDLSTADVGLFQPYREKQTLSYERMIGHPDVIAGFYHWASANEAFSDGMGEFRDSYFKILERIDCLETKTCVN